MRLFIISSLVCGMTISLAQDVNVESDSYEGVILNVQDIGSSSSRIAIYGYSPNNYGLGVAGDGSDIGGQFWGENYAGIQASSYYGTAGNFYGDVYGDHFYEWSDSRIKKNVKEITPTLEKVLRLKPKTYELDQAFTMRPEVSGEEVGLVAQEVEVEFPQLVGKARRYPLGQNGKPKLGQSTEYKAVNYTGLIPVLIKAVQEQQAQINEQKTQIDAMHAEIQQLLESR